MLQTTRKLLGFSKRVIHVSYCYEHHFAFRPLRSSQTWFGDGVQCIAIRCCSDKPTVGERIVQFFKGNASSSEGGKADNGDSADNDKSAQLVPVAVQTGPKEVLAVPLPQKPLFPGFFIATKVTDTKLVESLLETRAQGGQPIVAAFLRRKDNYDPLETSFNLDASDFSEPRKAITVENADELLHDIGTYGQVFDIVQAQGGVLLTIVGHRRVRRVGTLAVNPLKVSVEHLKDEPYDVEDKSLQAIRLMLLSTFKDMWTKHPLLTEVLQMQNAAGNLGNIQASPSKLADFAAAVTSAPGHQQQAVLEQLNVQQRCHDSLELLHKELEILKVQGEIQKQVEEKTKDAHKKWMLQEQLKYIKKELGLQKDDKSALVQRFQEKLQEHAARVPKAARVVIEEELEKLQLLEPASSEFNVTRNYLDWLTSMPWGTYTSDTFDLTAAKTILDEDHYGLDDVKERILEFIAVGLLKGLAQGKIVCLVGPPGVGKTSIGKSIARALNRKYYRFSVGGLDDVAEIKGHRRTYVGAMPGKLVQCLKTCESSNPLILIDEIDKLGRGFRGDPASALLELLDPEQNNSFVDHYLDVPLDLSKVLFMCTANVLDTIPGPLLDRMEVIRLSGYVYDEKVAIARKYLEKQARDTAGVPEGAVHITDEAMSQLIDSYCREAGVRNLKKQLDKMYRKSALKLIKDGWITPPPPAPEQPPRAAEADAAAETDAAAAGGTEVSDTEVTRTDVTDVSSLEPAPAAAMSNISGKGVAQGMAQGDAVLPEGEKDVEDGVSSTGSLDGADSIFDRSDSRVEVVLEAEPAPEAIGLSTVNAALDSNTAPHDDTAAKPAPPQAPVFEQPAINIGADQLKDFVGSPPFQTDKIYEQTPPGVVMGLAWTAMGGTTLYVEASSAGAVRAEPSPASEGPNSAPPRGTTRGSLRTTGQLGDVMKESAVIAHTFVRHFLQEVDPGNEFLESTDLHVHVPAGATPKDGPSAGCTMVTALLSLALNRSVKADMAMTGEVTLTGRVLPIGGVKEKLLAAKRAGVKDVIFPGGNRRDYDELTDNVKEGVQPHFVDWYREIFDIVLDHERTHGAQAS